MNSMIYLIFVGTLMNNSFISEAKAPKQCWDEDKNLPHETNCKLYYRCVYGIKVLKTCPNRKLFNPQLENCDDSYNVACASQEISRDEEEERFYSFNEPTNTENEWDGIKPIRSAESNSEAIVTYMDLVVPNFPNKCPHKSDPYEESTLLAHEKWCNAFYKCSNGEKYLMYCPGMLQFNPKVLSCDWPVNARCIEQVPATSTTEAPNEKTNKN
nr:probable chitinase 10 [Leptinotarsa decemlineata]